ncbi:growth-regulated alpha protein isoform X3 [Mirounga leonina]|uniref:growth-regulated alpha protein isoform X3 n=1 Tax=Mirounga leonina TaxID=9715 RepID=UPI00156C4AE6|nr:growth-regulated alpha protein isoform X3 [Mirounga leonina]
MRVAGRVPLHRGGGAALSFPTPKRRAVPGIPPAPGLLTSPRPPGIKAVLPAPGATDSAPPARAPARPLQAPPPRLSELSPMARAATAAAPRALRLLGAALLLLLLVPAGRRAAGEPVVAELRCQCLQTLQGIHFKNIQNVKVTPRGPHCAQTEVIATLKNGQEVCLNPEAPMVKKIINKMLNKVALKDGTLICLDPEAEWVMIIIKKIINSQMHN